MRTPLDGTDSDGADEQHSTTGPDSERATSITWSRAASGAPTDSVLHSPDSDRAREDEMTNVTPLTPAQRAVQLARLSAAVSESPAPTRAQARAIGRAAQRRTKQQNRAVAQALRAKERAESAERARIAAAEARA